MGAVAVLGGIWEIVFCGPAELARSPAKEFMRIEAPNNGGTASVSFTILGPPG